MFPSVRSQRYHQVEYNESFAHLEGQLILFTSPHQETWIIAAQTEEILSVHGYQTSGMDWGGVRSGEIFLTRVTAHQLDFFVEEAPLPDTRGLLLLRVHRAVGESGVI